jgi:hypothetical protein
MFWTVMLATGLAAVFVKLGAASVTVSVLGMALQAAALAIAILIVALLWKTFAK